MNWNKEDLATDVALITTFLNDDELRGLAKKKDFQKHIVTQKKLIAALLKNGYELMADRLPEEVTAEDVSFEKIQEELVVKVTPPMPEVQPETSSVGKPGNLLESVTQVFAEKTGYPEDMLESELDLEADLGIDTIKQMEILAEIREKFGLKKDGSFTLKQTPSISAVVSYIESL